jgi:hypothetical protein
MKSNAPAVSSGEAGESEGECVCGGEVAIRFERTESYSCTSNDGSLQIKYQDLRRKLRYQPDRERRRTENGADGQVDRIYA